VLVWPTYGGGQSPDPNSKSVVVGPPGVLPAPDITPSSSTHPDAGTPGGTQQNPPPPGGASGGQGSGADVIGGVAPRDIAVDVIQHVPFPELGVRMNPATGLVAVPGWFWVEGYDGRPFGGGESRDIPAEIGDDVPMALVPANDPRRRGGMLRVEVRVLPQRYEWDFGDGTRAETRSLGQPYPQESEVRHTYEYSSARAPGGFRVRLTVEFGAEFRVNGGPPQPLPPARRTYETAYRVQEIQTVLVAR